MSDTLLGAPGTPVAPRLLLEGVGVDLGGRRILDGVHLVLAAGSPVGLAGPSGSGKTVLCLVIAGALRPTRGDVRLDPPASEGAGRSTYVAGLVLQSHGLVSGLTAEENVALPLQARRVARSEVADRTARALGDVGLERHAPRLVDELSGGERQRVGIARAIALDPAVLVADEPTSELDPGNRERVLALFGGLARRGRVVVIASDDPEVAAGCGTVVSLERGAVTAVTAVTAVSDVSAVEAADSRN